MKTVCEKNKCCGCMACIDVCPKKAISIVDDMTSYNAVINESLCVNCNACHNVCQHINPSEMKKPIKWYQGWAKDEHIRQIASSGGVATEIIQSFIKLGGKVAACQFRNGEFTFSIAPDETNYKSFSGSKYVKSNPLGIYQKIKHLLSDGEKVLFIGLPCQVSSLKNYCKNHENLFTIDLVCHGSPSPKVLERFINQYDASFSVFDDMIFRKKSHYQVYSYKNKRLESIDKDGITDSYSIAFVLGLCFTENCYECQYAKPERVSDITLGDSWGSKLDASEQKKGISLLLCQTEKGLDLLKKCSLQLLDVDLENAVQHNHQLRQPFPKSSNREKFFENIKKDISFNKVVWRILPKQYCKQLIKRVLISLHLYKIG